MPTKLADRQRRERVVRARSLSGGPPSPDNQTSERSERCLIIYVISGIVSRISTLGYFLYELQFTFQLTHEFFNIFRSYLYMFTILQILAFPFRLSNIFLYSLMKAQYDRICK
jgi:hypothetical protein